MSHAQKQRIKQLSKRLAVIGGQNSKVRKTGGRVRSSPFKGESIRKPTGKFRPTILNGHAVPATASGAVVSQDETGIMKTYELETAMNMAEKKESTAKDGTVILTGSEYLTSIGFDGASYPRNPGTPIYAVSINPKALLPDFLGQMAELYEKFFFEEFSIEAIPIVPSTTGGTVVGGFYDDPGTPVLGGPAGSSNLRALMATTHSRLTSLFKSTLWNMNYKFKNDDDYKMINENNEPGQSRWQSQGIFMLLLGEAWTTDASLYKLILHYKLRLKKPRIQPAFQSVVNDDIVTCNFGSISATAGINFTTVTYGPGTPLPAGVYIIYDLHETAGTVGNVYPDGDVITNVMVVSQGVFFLKILDATSSPIGNLYVTPDGPNTRAATAWTAGALDCKAIKLE
jgi:hypothetical protein